MGFAFNPFTGNFDAKGSGGGGGASYIDGEVQNFSALPETLGSPAVDSAYLCREPEGTWLLNRKPAGIYIRTANTGTRASDWTYAGEFPDVFSDANFVLYDNGDSTKNLQFQLSGIDTATTRTLTAPNASGTIALTAQLTDTQVFTANGTWTKPAGAKAVHYLLIGGGGGGGGGRRSDSSTAASGGTGGNGGNVTIGWMDPASLNATESVTVGAGGAGGGARVTDNTNGATGSVGGGSAFGPITQGGTIFAAAGGLTTSASYNSNLTNSVLLYGALGASARGGGTSITGDSLEGIQSDINPSAGGGGGSKSSANVYYVGGNGGTIGQAQGRVGQTAGGQAAANAAGGSGGTSHMSFFGTGGAGGSPDSATGAANPGGNGGLYGGGGGGGSGSLNGAGGDNSGGNGADGIVVITTYF